LLQTVEESAAGDAELSGLIKGRELRIVVCGHAMEREAAVSRHELDHVFLISLPGDGMLWIEFLDHIAEGTGVDGDAPGFLHGDVVGALEPGFEVRAQDPEARGSGLQEGMGEDREGGSARSEAEQIPDGAQHDVTGTGEFHNSLHRV
jgi:hypothetical protein